MWCKENLDRHKLINNAHDLEDRPKLNHSTRLGDLKIRCGTTDFRCGAKEGKKGVALKVGEKAASHLTPLGNSGLKTTF